MNFDDTPAERQLRTEIRELIEAEVPPGFMGAFTNDPDDLEVANRFCRVLAERRLLCLAWPKEYGGGDGTPWEQTVVREEMSGAPRATRRSIHERELGRPVDHALRHPGTEGCLSAVNRCGHRHLVPGLLGTGRGLGPRLAQDRREARRRGMAHFGPEDLDVVCVDGGLVLPARAARIPTRPSTRASAYSSCRCAKRASKCVRSRRCSVPTT